MTLLTLLRDAFWRLVTVPPMRALTDDWQEKGNAPAGELPPIDDAPACVPVMTLTDVREMAATRRAEALADEPVEAVEPEPAPSARSYHIRYLLGERGKDQREVPRDVWQRLERAISGENNPGEPGPGERWTLNGSVYVGTAERVEESA